jgi:hypothetical protein
VASNKSVRASDPVRQERAAVFAAWVNELKVNVSYRTAELKTAAEQWNGSGYARPALFEALYAVAAPRTGHPQIDPNKLGLWLRRNVDTIVAGHKLMVDQSDKTRPRWKLGGAA